VLSFGALLRRNISQKYSFSVVGQAICTFSVKKSSALIFV
jgi:hypothetical protein